MYTDTDRYIQVKAVYDSFYVQGFVAILIFGNFLANAAQSELLPERGTEQDQIFNIIDLTFTWYISVYIGVYDVCPSAAHSKTRYSTL